MRKLHHLLGNHAAHLRAHCLWCNFVFCVCWQLCLTKALALVYLFTLPLSSLVALTLHFVKSSREDLALVVCVCVCVCRMNIIYSTQFSHLTQNQHDSVQKLGSEIALVWPFRTLLQHVCLWMKYLKTRKAKSNEANLWQRNEEISFGKAVESEGFKWSSGHEHPMTRTHWKKQGKILWFLAFKH